MPVYYFLLRDGQDVLLDPDGRDLATTAEVVAATLQEARELIAEDAREGEIRLDLRLDIEDGEGGIVHSLAFADAVRVVPADR
jgi:hypothetical protein